MIPVPTPIRHALVASMIGGVVGPQKDFNPYVLQRARTEYDLTPNAGAPGDIGFNPMLHVPTVVAPGYMPPRNSNTPVVMEDDGQGRVPLVQRQIQDQQQPASVFGQMRQSLPAATRSGTYSHQQALVERFMRNMRGVRQ